MKSKLKTSNYFRRHLKSIARQSFLWCVVLITFFILSCQQNKSQQQYTCSMNPEIVKTAPGNCPICGMELVLKNKNTDETKVGADLNYLLKPTNAVVISSIRTVAPVRKSMAIKISVDGVITYDTRNITSIAARYSGRIEKLFINYNFQAVKKGQKILEIYSAELVAAQRELLYILQSDKDNAALIEAAKEKLKLLGLSETQINNLKRSGKESTIMSLFSTSEGYIVEQEVVEKISTSSSTPQKAMGNSMNESTRKIESQKNTSQASEILVREGMYVTAGQIIFSVVNAATVWAEFDVAQSQNNLIHLGDAITIKWGENSDSLRATINFIQPFFKSKEPFTKVRVVLPNTGNRFSVGQLITGTFTNSSQSKLWLPSSAVMDLGVKKIVFVKKKNIFRPKEIITGQKSASWIELVSGLLASDSISYQAQTMMDSENFIRVKN